MLLMKKQNMNWIEFKLFINGLEKL